MTSSAAATPPRLTIGEVAELAGVSTRAVRHYHATGLLPEPARDPSGYRRYGADDVIAAVRVARLRALGMPIPQIANHLASPDGADEPARALLALAAELDREIAQLTATRDRLRELAGRGGFDRPAEVLADALRRHSRLAPDAELANGEGPAAALLDALHRQGIDGVLEHGERLLSSPAALERLSPLLARFRALDPDASPIDVDALARDVAAALPRPAVTSPPIDVALMDKLLGTRLNRAQRRFMHQLRHALAGSR